MNTPAPRVRLVVPTTGERLTYLQQCLDSITRQGALCEVVIVGPSSASEPLTRLAKRYSCRFLSERTSGLSNAINQGWEGASTDFLGWLGDDDLLAPGAVVAATEELDAFPSAAMVYGRVRVIDSEGDPIYLMRPGRYAPWLLRYGQNFVWQPGSLYRRTAVAAAGPVDPSLRYTMDFDLHLRLQRQGRLHYVPRLLACYRTHPTTLTSTNPDPYTERRGVMRRYLGPGARAWESWWWPVAKGVGRAWASAQLYIGREATHPTATTSAGKESPPN